MEQPINTVHCMYCHYRFVPQPIIKKVGKKRRTYLECPRCGNGIEREYRWYDSQRKEQPLCNAR